FLTSLHWVGERTLRELEAQPPGIYVSDADYASAYELMGNYDEMYRRLDRAVTRHDVRALTFECPDRGEPLPTDPRLSTLRRRMRAPRPDGALTTARESSRS